MKSVAARLKEIRLSAVPPLPIRAIAERLEMPSTSYERYEDSNRFKKAFLPMELTRRLANVLVDHGVDRGTVMALAGVDVDPDNDPGLSHNERWLIDLYRLGTDAQRAALLAVAATFGAPPPTPTDSPHQPTVHEQARSYRPPAQSAA